MSNDNSYISLGPLPPPPTFRRSYNTDRENMSATTIQSNERIRQAKEQVRKIKQDIRINNLALNTLQQGFNILKVHMHRGLLSFDENLHPLTRSTCVTYEFVGYKNPAVTLTLSSMILCVFDIFLI